MHLELVRDLSLPYCTLGRLMFMGRTLFTIERPWVPDPNSKGGRKGFSCVPVGAYKVNRHSSESFPKTFALTNPMLDVYHMPWEVPPGREHISRTACLIHAANWAHELRGCIAPGRTRVRDQQNRWMVGNSRDAMNELRTVIGGTIEIHLTIIDNSGG